MWNRDNPFNSGSKGMWGKSGEAVRQWVMPLSSARGLALRILQSRCAEAVSWPDECNRDFSPTMPTRPLIELSLRSVFPRLSFSTAFTLRQPLGSPCYIRSSSVRPMHDAITRLSAQLVACNNPTEAVMIGRALREAITEHIKSLHGKTEQMKRMGQEHRGEDQF